MDEREIRNLIEQLEYSKECLNREVSRLDTVLLGLYEIESDMHREDEVDESY